MRIMNRLRIIFESLLSINERDVCGMILWLFLSLIVSAVFGWKGVLFLIVMMAASELRQYNMYHMPCFEWEDVVRYPLVILIGAVSML